MDNYIGRMLDNRYEILEVIGVGGMAVVYKARCHRLNRLVAIKILKDEFSQDAEFRRRFHAESQAVAMLSHPNIVSVYDVSHSGDTDYIVMELIDGITLKQYMEQKGQLNWREVLHFSTQIAKALEHAHSRGIIHRDIKPHNIMILKDGSVKVADFGIARITSAQSTLTREALGSVHYISPEQARGSRVDKRTDLYSLGVVMYEMLTGRPPFDGESPVAVAIQHINGSPILPTEICSSVPKGLEQITMHAMTAVLDQRYESATDMLMDLEEFRKNPNVVFDFQGTAVSQKTQVMDPIAGEGAMHPAERPMPKASQVRKPEVKPERTVKAAKRAERPSKGNKAALVAGIICIVLAVFGIFYFLYSFFLEDLFSKTKDVVVPSLLGERYDEINPEDYPDFEIIADTWINDASVAENVVISQSPRAESTVKAGSQIKLTISLGPETEEIKMPDLVGQSAESAQSRLFSLLGYQAQVSLVNDDEVPKGEVISTDPVYGTVLDPGQLIILTVSDGPKEELVKVPPLVGLDVDEAVALLRDRGLEDGQISYVDNDTAKDTVIFQSIEQDKEVPKGTVINLQVSNGPEDEPSEQDPNPPEEQDPNKPDNQPGTDPTTPHTQIVSIPLNGEGEAELTIRIDGEIFGTPMTVDRSQGYIDVEVSGIGWCTLDAYLDGVRVYSQTIDFGA